MASELANKLKIWALDEMSFNLEDTSEKELLKELNLLCHGQNAEIWKYITKYVHSRRMVRKIQTSLKYQKMKSNFRTIFNVEELNEKELLEKEYLKTKEEHNLIQIQTGHIEKGIQQLQFQILASESKLKDKLRNISSIEHSKAFHSMYHETINMKIDGYNSLNEGITYITKKLDGYERPPEKEEKSATMFSDIVCQKANMETTIQKKVRILSESLREHLKLELNNEDSEHQKENKLRLHKDIFDITQIYSPNQLVQTLTYLANYHKDTWKSALISEQNETLESNISEDTIDILYGLIFKHIKNFYSEEAISISIVPVKENIAKNKSEIIDKIRFLNLNKDQESLARKLVAVKLQEFSLNQHITSLFNLSPELRKRQITYDSLKNNLDSDIKQMKMNTEKIEDDFYLALSLIKQNKEMLEMINVIQTEEKNYIKDELYIPGTSIVEQCKQISRIPDEFSKLIFYTQPSLYTIPFGDTRIPVESLCIYRGESFATLEGVNELSSILYCINVKDFESIDDLYSLALRFQKKMKNLNLIKQDEANAKKLLKEASIKDEKEMTNAIIKEMDKNIFPSFEKSLAILEYTTNKMESVKEHLKIWWELPVKNIATKDSMINNKTYAEWMRKWKVAVTALRNKELKRLK